MLLRPGGGKGITEAREMLREKPDEDMALLSGRDKRAYIPQ